MIAGREEDLDSIQALLAFLPDDAYGQVFIEASIGAEDSAHAWDELAMPDRVSLTRLHPSTSAAVQGGSDGAVVTRDVTLAKVISTWCAEWMPDEPTIDRIVQVWIGGRDSAVIDQLCSELPCELQRL